MVACTRDNGAFDGGDVGASSGASEGTKGDSLDGPEPGTSAATGAATSAADGTTTASTSPVTSTAAESTSTGEGTGETGSPLDTGDPGPLPSSCCNVEAPCENGEVAKCTCNADPACCGADWGQYCVAVAVSEGCAMLDCAPPPHSCCMYSNAPGCSDFEIMACVCADSPQCCEGGWTQLCVKAAFECPSNTCLE